MYFLSSAILKCLLGGKDGGGIGIGGVMVVMVMVGYWWWYLLSGNNLSNCIFNGCFQSIGPLGRCFL